MESTYVCEASELKPGERVVLNAGRRRIMCVNSNGRFFAMSAICPHRGADLLYGELCGTMLPSQPSEYVYGKHNELVRCPWHGWQFDLATGESTFDKQTCVRTFPVKIVGTALHVELNNV